MRRPSGLTTFCRSIVCRTSFPPDKVCHAKSRIMPLFGSRSFGNCTLGWVWVSPTRYASLLSCSTLEAQVSTRTDSYALLLIGLSSSVCSTLGSAKRWSRRRHPGVDDLPGALKCEAGRNALSTLRPTTQVKTAIQAFETFSAAGPLAPCTISNSTASPSASDLNPLP
jgi:hypothetical protein